MAMAGASVGIVGAGLAAATCARALAAAGVRSTIYEQGRGAGGRLATRATRGSAVRINHGAPAFTAGGDEFRRMVGALQAEGAAEQWNGPGGCRLGVMDGRRRGSRDGLQVVDPPGLRLYRGTPTMSALGGHLVAAAAPCVARVAEHTG